MPAIKALIDKYGVHFDPALRDQVLARYQKLNVPTYWAGINADLTARFDASGKVTAVALSYPRDFCEAAVGLCGHVRAKITVTSWPPGSIPTPSPAEEIVDLRRLSARELEPLLEEETATWRDELEWDFVKSADLVRRFVDLRALERQRAPGARRSHRVCLLRAGREQRPGGRPLCAPRLPHRGAREPAA